MKALRFFFTLFINAVAFSFVSYSQAIPDSAVFEGHRVMEKGAWCWFADPRALHVSDVKEQYSRTFLGAIDSQGNIKATQFDLKSGRKDEVLIRSCFQPDDHNNPTFLSLPDGRIMIFYSRHTDEACFYYRISELPGDITRLGPEKKIPTNHNTTYPSPFYLTSDPEHFYLCWRGINWHPTIACLTLPDANGNVSFVKGPYQIVQSTGARPYAKYCSNGRDQIWLAYTTGHPDNEYPNYLYCNRISIPSLQLSDVSGAKLSVIGEDVHRINKTTYPAQHPLAVADAPADKRDWLWQILLDKKGNPVVAMVKISEDKQQHEYWYLHWNGAAWKSNLVANGGGAFHQSSGLEQCYSGGMVIDEADPSLVYCSVPVTGSKGAVYELVQYQLDENDVVLTSKAITYNSRLNNVRPYIVSHSEGTPLRLAWMHGNYYDWIVSRQRPQGYPTSLHVQWQPAVSDAILNKPKAFHLTANVRLRPGANGDLLRIGKATWGIDSSDLKPYLRTGRTLHKSNNALATSDGWQKQPRGTNRAWYSPEPITDFVFDVEYKNGLLTIRRDGMIDQVVALKEVRKLKVKPVNGQAEFFWSLNTPFSGK